MRDIATFSVFAAVALAKDCVMARTRLRDPSTADHFVGPIYNHRNAARNVSRQRLEKYGIGERGTSHAPVILVGYSCLPEVSMIVRARIVIACAVAGLGFAPAAFAGFVVFSVGGDDTIASIQTTVDDFRAALGDPLNGNAAGPLPDGRREINWDGGGATTASPVGTPFAGFQNTRGALFTTAGTGFLQTPLDAPELFAINPTYGTTFGFFSQLRIFTPIASNVVDVTFFIPGSGGLIPATVGGFGAVFTDVDLAGTSRIEFFDVNNNVLFTDTVDPGSVADGSLSFLGAVANAGEDIFRVRLIAGTTALGPNDNPTGGTDVAAFDDYLYAEPQRAVSEPSVLLLLGSALCALVGWGWIRRRRRTPRSR